MSSVPAKFQDLAKVICRPSPFGNETGTLPNGEFKGTEENFASLGAPVLVIGAGGLGCEILKNLALSGFTNLELIDLDTIDVTNLNRQFLFRRADVGRAKAEVAAEFVMRRVPSCVVKWHKCKIQDFKADFYSKFKVIVCGLDNVDARRWLNSMVVSLAEFTPDGDLEEGSVCIPIVDGGTEAFKGQARVIIPKITSCLECSMELFTPQTSFQICTISNTPRTPEHCIAYAFMVEWDKSFPGRVINKDSPEDMRWIFERAEARAREFGIEGVTYFKTMGVVKSIIPAIASTNAIISAACTNEVLKLVTFCGQSLNNWYAYYGDSEVGIYTNSYEHGAKDDCFVCKSVTHRIEFSPSKSLREFREMLEQDARFLFKNTSMRSERPIYIPGKNFEQILGHNLDKTMFELVSSFGPFWGVTSSTLEGPGISVEIVLQEE